MGYNEKWQSCCQVIQDKYKCLKRKKCTDLQLPPFLTLATSPPTRMASGDTASMTRVSSHARYRQMTPPAMKVDIHCTKVDTLSPIPR